MKNTKKSLLLSVTALILCCALLAGTTLAWFTGSVSSGVNTIKAGNLDIVLEYYDGSSWKPVTESTKLFDDTALWEPGHTEVAYLHIKNVGSLDLKYRMNVNIPSETGSINQNGEAFKLSDYLVFKAIDMTPANPMFADRAAARQAAGNEMGLSSWTKANELYANPNSGSAPAGAVKEEYLALVIYMPENVGNEANHKTGVNAPTIELGVNIVATQLNSESDSFGTDYDANADGTPDYGAAWNMAAFRAVADVPANVATTGMTVVKYENDTGVEADLLAKVTIPASTASNAGLTTGDKVAVSVKPADVPAGVTIGEDEAAFNFDVKLKKIGNDNAESDIAATGYPVTVELKVGSGLNGVRLFHTSNGVTNEITGVRYDANTGIATFTTESFSDYTVVYNTKGVTEEEVLDDIVVTVDGVATAFNVADYEEEVAQWNAGTYTTPLGYRINKRMGPYNAEYVTLCHALWFSAYGRRDVTSEIVLNKDFATIGRDNAYIFCSDELSEKEDSEYYAYVENIPTVVLDLNGHSIEFCSDNSNKITSYIEFYNANLTIKDSVGTGEISGKYNSVIYPKGNGKLTIESGKITTDFVDSITGTHGVAVRIYDTYVETPDCEDYLEGTIEIKGGTLSFDYMNKLEGTPENPTTIKAYKDAFGYPSRYEGYDQSMPVGIFFHIDDGHIPAGYTWIDNHDGTFTVVSAQ